jgi:hypothetical protein
MPASQDKHSEPLRGDAAWRAEVREITKRNDAARAAGMRQRAAKDATAIEEAARVARREMQHLRDDKTGR